MQALILAAGRGSRLKEITDNKPKCMTLLHNKPLLQYQIEALSTANIKNIIGCVGYHANVIKHFFSKTFQNPNWSSSNMVTSFFKAHEQLINNTTIVSYSDIIYSPSIIQSLQQAPGDIVIAYDPDWLEQWSLRFSDPLDDAETFRFNAKNELLEIGAKPSSVDEVQGQYMGLLKITPIGYQKLYQLYEALDPKTQDTMDFTSFINLCLKHEITINVVPNRSFWFEIDNQKDLKICTELTTR